MTIIGRDIVISGATFGIASTIFLLILVWSFFRKDHLNNNEIRIFSYLIIINLIGLLLEILLNFSAIKIGVSNTFCTVLGKVFLLSYIAFTNVFFFYVLNISIEQKKYEKYRKKMIITSLILSIIISVTILLLPLYIEYTNAPYSYGPAVEVLYKYSFIMIILCMIVLFINYKRVKNNNYVPLIAYIFGTILVAIIQKLNPTLTLSTSVDTILLFIMYHTVENPDIKMLEQVSLAKEQADKANHAKTDFLSNMSHEIRTPLNAIVGFSHSLKDEELSESAQEKVDDIIMASNNLLEIVNGILDISKIEANKLEIINKEYETKELFNELVALTNARIGNKGLDFRVNIDPSMPGVLYGDNTRLKQVILNILTNAVKYTKEGYIDFRVSTVIKDNVCRLIISVEDSGIGIKEENLPKLFSKFERLNVENSLTIEGTGLGLAITKKLVELMNGKVIVQSVYGQGSKFTISIDQRIVSFETPKIKETQISESKAINANGARVLIVDDNDLNLKVASTLMKKYNLNIDTANSGFLCLNKINQGEQYDLIFLDDMMPKLSGRETFAKLKSNPNFNIPVIALTANAIDGMKEEYLSLGFNDYLSKPIEKPELERVISTYITKNAHEEVNAVTSTTSSIINLNNYQGKKVLLVDDNEINLKVALMQLKKYELDITQIMSGSDCISKCIENKYDLILLDDMMPELDGCKTLENLKTLEGFDTPVVLMTASKEDEVHGKIEQYGFNGYLGKPLIKEEVESVLGQFLNK